MAARGCRDPVRRRPPSRTADDAVCWAAGVAPTLIVAGRYILTECHQVGRGAEAYVLSQASVPLQLPFEMYRISPILHRRCPSSPYCHYYLAILAPAHLYSLSHPSGELLRPRRIAPRARHRTAVLGRRQGRRNWKHHWLILFTLQAVCCSASQGRSSIAHD